MTPELTLVLFGPHVAQAAQAPHVLPVGADPQALTALRVLGGAELGMTATPAGGASCPALLLVAIAVLGAVAGASLLLRRIARAAGRPEM